MKDSSRTFLIIAFIFLTTIGTIMVLKQDKPLDARPPGPNYNYWHPTWDENNPRTIIPNGEGIIEYSDGTRDSIRWQSDELRMWIGGDGDTIWE